jgi:hypothetical protein
MRRLAMVFSVDLLPEIAFRAAQIANMCRALVRRLNKLATCSTPGGTSYLQKGPFFTIMFLCP